MIRTTSTIEPQGSREIDILIVQYDQIENNTNI